MCDCRKNIEKRLTDHYAAQLPDSRDVEVKLQGYALVFSDGKAKSLPSMQGEVRHTVTVKKTGADKRKTGKTNMIFTFCPFCGVKLGDSK